MRLCRPIAYEGALWQWQIHVWTDRVPLLIDQNQGLVVAARSSLPQAFKWFVAVVENVVVDVVL